MKTKMKSKTKRIILTILSIISFLIIVGLIHVMLTGDYGWIKY